MPVIQLHAAALRLRRVEQVREARLLCEVTLRLHRPSLEIGERRKTGRAQRHGRRAIGLVDHRFTVTYPVLRPFPCNSLLLQIADQKGGSAPGASKGFKAVVRREIADNYVYKLLAAY